MFSKGFDVMLILNNNKVEVKFVWQILYPPPLRIVQVWVVIYVLKISLQPKNTLYNLGQIW